MLVIKSHRRLLWAIAVLFVPNVSSSEAASIQIESANLHSIEISYSINTGGQNFCYLAISRENESVVSGPSVSYRIITDTRADEARPLAEYTQYKFPAELEKLSVFSLPNNREFTGEIVIHAEGGIPYDTEFNMQLVVRGFACDAISPVEKERGFSFDEVDTQTSAPMSVADDKLEAIYSDEFRIDFNRR